MALVELEITVPVAQEDLAVEQLGEYSPGGFRHDLPADSDAEGAVATFGLFLQADRADAAVSYLARAGVDVLSQRVTTVEDGWDERWKEFHQPVTIGTLWVGPPWQEELAPPGLQRVVIEPGQGFGTGAHPTTHLMLTLLLEQPRASVLDIGCGSGVLAVAAALLGFGPIIAVDNDPVAVTSTEENLERNGVSHLVQARLADGLADPLPAADIVLANIILEPLVALAPRLRAPRVLVSGLLRSQVEEVEAAFAANEYVVRERRDRDGWVALQLDTAREDRATMRHRQAF
jgi:ribosomal protein L11 methyltransferase